MRRGLYTIPSGTGFLNRLAEGLWTMAREEDGSEQLLALSAMRIILPTRRAGRELRQSFLALSGHKPVLLPRVQPIGDIDSAEIDMMMAGYGMDTTSIPPAIPLLERQFLLAQQIMKKDSGMAYDTALMLANDLGRLIDTVHTEDMDFSNLAQIVPSTLSMHWERTLKFLEIVTRYWPDILAERGHIDPADRRNRLLKKLATLWREQPPQTPIIAAGSTGSIPSAGELLKVIAELPRGIVVLPSLDKELDDESWHSFTDTHPQATLRHLLNRMGKTRDDVTLWPEAEKHISPRSAMIRAVMRPAETFGQGRDVISFDKALDNLTIIEAGTPRDEARVIALTLRHVMEDTEKTACFITPDRLLARRVMTALKRWDIDVDDSAGSSLIATQGATFLLSILRVMVEHFAPLALLDFLKHPYQQVIDRTAIYRFEKFCLRGPRPAGGLDGLRKRAGDNTDLATVITTLEKIFTPFLSFTNGEHPVHIVCQTWISIAEQWTGDESFLWRQSESESLSQFLSHIINYGTMAPALTLSSFANMMQTLLADEKYRDDDAPHRRILILGQLESRLVVRDVMIVGGLNEGTWPRDTGHDPWMSRPMRRAFGLPSPERGVGLSAHDFAEHVSNPCVVVTRSLKSEGTATVPARWLEKLRTLLIAEGITPDWAESSSFYLSLSQSLDRPRSPIPLSFPTPAPCPPLHTRPQELSATAIERWINNPYRLYAEKILKLKPMNIIDEDTMHADRGSFVHDVLMDFVKTYPATIPDDAHDIILFMAREKLTLFETIQPHWHYWWPRFERMVDWFLQEEKALRTEATPWLQEETGRAVIYQNSDTQRSFTVTAKADRLDKIKTGGVAVIDYKTGQAPSLYRLKNGTAPQLPIEGYIVQQGGYRGEAQTPERLMVWKLSGGHHSQGQKQTYKSLDIPSTIAATGDGLKALVSSFEDEKTPYIARPLSGRLYDDDIAYAHLARMKEWSSGEQQDDDTDDEGDTE